MELFFRTFANGTRLKIIKEIVENPGICVCELAPLLGKDISTITRPLAILRQSNIISIKRSGRRIIPVINFPEKIHEILKIATEILQEKEAEIIEIM